MRLNFKKTPNTALIEIQRSIINPFYLFFSFKLIIQFTNTFTTTRIAKIADIHSPSDELMHPWPLTPRPQYPDRSQKRRSVRGRDLHGFEIVLEGGQPFAWRDERRFGVSIKRWSLRGQSLDVVSSTLNYFNPVLWTVATGTVGLYPILSHLTVPPLSLTILVQPRSIFREMVGASWL